MTPKKRPPRIALQVDAALLARLDAELRRARKTDGHRNFSDVVRAVLEAGLAAHEQDVTR